MNYLKGLKHLPSLCEAETIFFDCETTGLQPVFGGLRLLQLATFQAPPVVIDCWDLKDDDWVVLEEFFDVEREWVAHNAVFDLGWLQEHCIYPRGRVLCTMLASRVLTNGLPNIKNGLQPVVKRYLGKEISKEEQRSDWSVPELRAEQIEYAAYDVQLLSELYEPIQHRMADGGLHKAWYLECAALPAMAQLWRTGLPFDKQMLEELRDELEGDNQRLGEQFIV
jgi:ribonuclease D